MAWGEDEQDAFLAAMWADIAEKDSGVLSVTDIQEQSAMFAPYRPTSVPSQSDIFAN